MKLIRDWVKFEELAELVGFEVEQFGWDDPEAKFIKPLIDGKYAEYPYARITIYNNESSLDWQRHTGQWATLFRGSLHECMKFVNETGGWFE